MKKMSKGMLMTALICGAVYLGGSPVYASELQEFSLDEYVVTAARTETKLVDTPANISVVDAQTIEERHYQDVSEVLKDVPGANVLDTGHGASEKLIKLNGDERVLVLVDGRRVNVEIGPTSGGRAGFDMNQLPDVGLIERIEILKGAGGALYGSDAVGGVVNIITKKSNSSYGKVTYGTGSFGEKDYSAMYSFRKDKTGITVAASNNEKDYYKYRDNKSNSTKKWLGKSDYKNEKVSLKVDHELSTEQNLTIGYDYSKFEGNSPTSATYFSQATLDKKTENMYAKYDWKLNGSDDGYIQYYHNELNYFNAGSMEEKTDGIDMQQTLTIAENNQITFGTSWRKSNVKTSGTNNYDESIENIAFFVNDIWEFIPSWTLNSGVRYDNHSEAGDETTLSFALNKKFNDDSHMYLNWGQVFRAPNADDLYYNGEMDYYGTTYISLGDPNLKPETGENWTIGYSTKLTEKTNFDINYFESDLKDAIDWETIKYDSNSNSSTSQVKNVNKQEKRGMEISVNHELNDNLDVFATYTYIRVKNNEHGAGFVRDVHYNPNMYRLGINYHDGKWNANAWLRYGSGCDTTVDQYGYGNYADSSYLTVDVAVTYKATEDLSFYAKGYNLFNEAYAEFAGTTNGSYDYPAQSRRFIVGAEYKF